MDIGKVYKMVTAMLWSLVRVDEDTGEVIILTHDGAEKQLRYFETDDCVGLKNEQGNVVVERWK